MTAVLTPPPSRLDPVRDGRPARRAIRRWGWRLLRREWRQQALVMALLALAVAASVFGLGVVVNLQSTDRGTTGNANLRVDISSPGGGVAADVAYFRQHYGSVQAIEKERVPIAGVVTPLEVRAQDPHASLGAPMLRLVRGRYPAGPGEVAMTSSVQTLLDLSVGDRWSSRGDRSLRVVGTVENPNALSDAFALVAPGAISDPAVLTLLMNGRLPAPGSLRPPAGSVDRMISTGSSAAQEKASRALAVLLITTVALTFVGLLAVAGFTTMAHRRLRSLGMIAAIGATDRQVRRVLLANGTAVGAVGAATGLLVGLVAWFASRSLTESLVGHRIDLLDLPWWAVGAGAVLTVVTSLAAAWWPARSAARLPIVVALSGRPVPPKSAHRFTLVGLALAAVGFVSLVYGNGSDKSQDTSTGQAVAIVLGIVATAVGMLLLAPLLIRLLATAAGLAPVSIRLALRELGRYQSRSGAAVAAASLAVGIAAALGIIASAELAADSSAARGNLPANQLIVWLQNPAAGPPTGGKVSVQRSADDDALTGAQVAAARRAAGSIARALNAGNALELDLAMQRNSNGPDVHYEPTNLVRPMHIDGHSGFTVVAAAYLATPAILAHYGIRAGTVPPSADVLTSRHDVGANYLAHGPSLTLVRAHVQTTSRLPRYTSAPTTLITPRLARDWALTAQPAGWLLQTPHALTARQTATARRLAAAAGIAVETRSGPDDSLPQVRDYATAIGILLALCVLAMSVGLLRSQTARDVRTLAATGAGAGTRRLLTGVTAAALGLLAGVLGTAGAYLALIAWHWHDLDYLAHPPYANLAVLVLGLPLVALVGGWLLGRPPTGLGRGPLE